MDRNALLLGDAGPRSGPDSGPDSRPDPGSRILEIGPSHAPIAPKRGGWNTFVVDHASAADLRAKYTGYPVDLDAIEEVDAIWRGGRLDDAIPAEHHRSFDRLIASHVLEHIPDIVTFMVSAQRLLAPDGALALAVPDKRYCFDALKPVTTTGDILAGFDPDGAGRHSRRTIFNQIAYSIRADGAIAWGQHPVAQAELMSGLHDAFAIARAAGTTADSEYVDAHAWQFTPSAFRLAILELADEGLIDWHVADCTTAIGSEFIATLRRGRPTWPSRAAREAERLRLLLAIQVELREQIDLQALGGMVTIPPQPADPAIARAFAALNARIDAQDGQLAEIGRILAPPTDQPAELGTLADLTARLDAQQRALVTVVSEDGTQASIMRALSDVAIRQDHQAKQIAAVFAALAAQHEQISSITAADGTQATVMQALENLGIRATHLHQAIDNAAQAAHHAPQPVLRAIAELNARLDAQQARLEDVHRDTSRLARMLRPFLRLRARITGRPFIE